MSCKRSAAFSKSIIICIFATYAPFAAAYEQVSVSQPGAPTCKCSSGVEIKYSDSDSNGHVYISSCSCGQQECAVSWNKSITMECVRAPILGIPQDKPSASLVNCADFTKLDIGTRDSSSIEVGSFIVSNNDASGSGGPSKIHIKSEEIKMPDGSVITTPNHLKSMNTSFVYPEMYTDAQIDIAFFYKKVPGLESIIEIDNGLNRRVRFNVPSSEDQGVTQRVKISDQSGIKKIIFPSPEVDVFEVCAFGVIH